MKAHADRIIRLLCELSRTPLAIEATWLHALTGAIREYAATGEWNFGEVLAARFSPQAAKARGNGTVAVVPVHGVITYRGDVFDELFGGGSVPTLRLRALIQQLTNDPEVKSIVLDVDSPGGTVGGLETLSDTIHAAREQKRIVAVSNTLMASAAYWLASAATEVVAVPESGTGSIGVWTAHVDLSKMLEEFGIKVSLISAGKHKVEGNPYEPLSPEAREFIQSQVDEYYGMFVKAVARNRGDTPESVREGYGQGRVLTAKEARKAKLVDRVATLEDVVAALEAKATPRRREAARAELERVTRT